MRWSTMVILAVVVSSCVSATTEPSSAPSPLDTVVRSTSAATLPAQSTSPAEPEWPEEPSIVAYVAEVHPGPVITLENGERFAVGEHTRMFGLCGQQSFEQLDIVDPCLVLINSTGATIDEIHTVGYNESFLFLDGPIFEIRDDLALIETPLGVFTVQIAPEVDTGQCGGGDISRFVGTSALYFLYLDDSGRIDTVACYGTL